jgi:hypothetical protein
MVSSNRALILYSIKADRGIIKQRMKNMIDGQADFGKIESNILFCRISEENVQREWKIQQKSEDRSIENGRVYRICRSL